MSRIIAGLGALALIGGLGAGLAACASSGSSVPKPAAASSSAPAVNYGQQYLNDIKLYSAAAAAVSVSATITSPSVVHLGVVVSGVAKSLLTQSWPANAQPDIKTQALDAEKINADIQNQDLTALSSDAETLSAQSAVVRVDLGLPPSPVATPTPTVTKTVAAPAKTVTAPAPRTPELLNAQAVVTQYYADINDGNFADAWNNLGGSIIAGPDYNGWVAGFDTTTGVSLSSWSFFGSDQVTVQLAATQTDGSVNYYTGTYAVQNGEIVSASIVQN